MAEWIVELGNGIPHFRKMLVRCKDCKHRPYEDAYCNPVFTDDVCPCQCYEDPYYGWNPPDDWFCPEGER